MSKKDLKNENINIIKKKKNITAIIAKCLVGLIVGVFLFAFGFTYQLREGDCAVIMRFGAVRKEISEAGLYLKLPWPFESVVSYDSKLQYLESKKLETTTKDKRNVILQSYVVWNVDDPVLYHNSVGKSGFVEAYINDQVFSATNSTLGNYNLTELVSLNRNEIKLDQIQEEIFTRVRDNCKENYGVAVDDVSILRLSLPESNLQSVFEKMWADREKDIETILANAKLEANKIITGANSEASKIEGEGVMEAAKIKAEVEKAVAKIYADAQEANIELYKFLTDLDTFVGSVNSSSVLVVKADQYPFNILNKYSKDSSMAPSGDEVVIRDLNYILSSKELSNEDRTALINAITQLIEEYSTKNGITIPGSGK